MENLSSQFTVENIERVRLPISFSDMVVYRKSYTIVHFYVEIMIHIGYFENQF